MKSKKDVFPNDQTLKRIRAQLSDADYQGGNIALPASASEVDRAKYQACQIVAKLGVDESRVSDLLRDKIESFILDRLIGYVEKLHPGMRIQIIAA